MLIQNNPSTRIIFLTILFVVVTLSTGIASVSAQTAQPTDCNSIDNTGDGSNGIDYAIIDKKYSTCIQTQELTTDYLLGSDIDAIGSSNYNTFSDSVPSDDNSVSSPTVSVYNTGDRIALESVLQTSTASVADVEVTTDTKQLLADGSTEAVVTLQLVDQDGNPVERSDVSISWLISGSSSAEITRISEDSTTDSTGQAKLRITADTPGEDIDVTGVEEANGYADSVRLETLNEPNEAAFQINLLDGPTEITQGENYVVRATVSNDGGTSGTQTIQYTLEGNVGLAQISVQEQVELDAGESTRVTFDLASRETDTLETGNYMHIISSNDDEVTTQTTVVEAQRANFQLSDLSGPSAVTQGENYVVRATVSNDGGASGTQAITYGLTDNVGIYQIQETTYVEIDSGQSKTVEFRIRPNQSSSLETGEYTHTVSSNDDSVSQDVTIIKEDGSIPNRGASIAMENVSASNGEKVPVLLTASGDVAGYTATINFDPSEIRITDVSGQDLLRPAANINNNAGLVTISQSQASAVTDPTLARISVRVIGNSGSALRFDTDGTTINDENAARQITSYSNGGVTVRECVPGDANTDGRLTPFDGTLVNRKIVGASVVETYDADCADANGDGQVTALDATVISQEIVGDLLMTTKSSVNTDASAMTEALTPSTSINQVSGSRKATVSVGSVSGLPGDQVSIPVSVSNESISGYVTQINFDPTVIEVDSVEGADFDKPEYSIDNTIGVVGLTQSRADEIEGPVVAQLNATIVGQPGAATDLLIDQSITQINNNTKPSIKMSTRNGTATVSTERVQITNSTITPSTISNNTQMTHMLRFETQGISSDGVQDNFTIIMPDAVEIEELNGANVTNGEYEINASQNGNRIDLEVNPDRPAETVNLTIEVPVELSVKNNKN